VVIFPTLAMKLVFLDQILIRKNTENGSTVNFKLLCKNNKKIYTGMN